MLDTLFVVAPIAYHAFFEQAEFKCLLRDDLFEIFSFPTQFLHLVRIWRTRRVPGQPLLTGFHEVLGPLVIDALGYPLMATQISNAVLATLAIQNDPDLLFR